MIVGLVAGNGPLSRQKYQLYKNECTSLRKERRMLLVLFNVSLLRMQQLGCLSLKISVQNKMCIYTEDAMIVLSIVWLSQSNS